MEDQNKNTIQSTESTFVAPSVQQSQATPSALPISDPVIMMSGQANKQNSTTPPIHKSSSKVYGIVSIVFGLISNQIPASMLFFTFASVGSSSNNYMLLPLAALVLSVMGLYFAIRSYKYTEGRNLLGLAGFVINLITLVALSGQLWFIGDLFTSSTEYTDY